MPADNRRAALFDLFERCFASAPGLTDEGIALVDRQGREATISPSLAGSHGLCGTVAGMELVQVLELIQRANAIATLSYADNAMDESVHRHAAGVVVVLLTDAERLIETAMRPPLRLVADNDADAPG